MLSVIIFWGMGCLVLLAGDGVDLTLRFIFTIGVYLCGLYFGLELLELAKLCSPMPPMSSKPELSAEP
jgi:hypothetical protein